ncbi:hypothetical protein [Limosilactobacillus fermentum]|uniref:hypothetical protein n=1 Tax=Limosilactobacillus fermentum TaxID=1613 RepID=UPI000B0A0857|nr:hypothetical protein [Limosilactobacillus fermentum]
MKKIIVNSGWLIALLLTVMNLWMWDSQLQFSNYSENNLKMAVLQLVHVILIIAELWLLMQLGRTLKRHRLGRTRVITTWLVLVAYGAGSVLLQLVWKNQFYFSDLLNAVFPITRNIFPLATAYIIAMATFPRVNELSEVNRRFLGKVLVGMFLLQKNQVIGEHQILNGGIYSSLVLAGLPLLRSHYVGFAAGHVGNLGLKILLVAIIAGAVMAVGFVANWCLRRLFSSLAITQHYERWVEELPSHLMEWPAWLKKFCHRHWPALTAVGASYLLAIIGLWLTFSDLALGPANPEYNSFSYQVLNRQGTLIFTTILIWLFFKILQSITSKYWLSLCLTSGLMLVFFIADHIKLGLRDEPILPADVTSVQTFGEILKFVSVWVVIAGVVGVLLLVIIGLILDHRYRVPSPNVKCRLLWTVLTVCFFGSSALWNHTNSRISSFLTGLGNYPLFYSQIEGAHQNGPIIQFMNNIDVTVMEKPAGYSRARMEKIVKEYQVVAKEINKDRKNSLSSQTIMFNLSESFSNPKRVPGVKIKGNPIPYILSLKKTTTSGLMMSSGYGGGRPIWNT